MPRRSSGDARQPEPARLQLADGSVATCPQGIFTWSDVTIADAHYVVKVPTDTPMVEAAILGCAVMTGAGAVRNTAVVKAGDSVAVIGVGGVGLSAVTAARVAGAEPIVAVDLSDSKLRLAHDFGATHLVNGRQCDPVEEIRSLTRSDTEYTYGGEAVSGVDFAFDCIGMPATMGQAVAIARSGTFGGKPGGTAVLVGAPSDTFELDARDMLVNEKRFIGSLGGSSTPDRDVPEFLEWHRSGVFEVGRLVTDRFELDQINVAVEALANGAVRGRAVLTFGNGDV
jgi:Zn-dependent alcohol dehydrogenase